MQKFEVYSSLDDGVVFSGRSVEWEAKIRRISPRRAALAIARENEDPLTSERLFVRATPERVAADEESLRRATQRNATQRKQGNQP